jgi:hypothetical protein
VPTFAERRAREYRGRLGRQLRDTATAEGVDVKNWTLIFEVVCAHAEFAYLAGYQDALADDARLREATSID